MKTIANMINKDYNKKEMKMISDLVKDIITLSNKAYEEGILSMEQVYPTLQPHLLQKGVDMLMEGYSPVELKEEFKNYIRSRQNSKIDLLEAYIIQEGLILLQDGACGDTLYHKLLSLSVEGFNTYLTSLSGEIH